MEEVRQRRRAKCMQCGDEMTYRYCDPKRRQSHWAHLPRNVEKKCKGTAPETETHKLAKEMLCAYLNAGNTIMFKCSCYDCDRRWSVQFSCARAITEVSYINTENEKCVLDVGCFDAQKQLITCVEVEMTHRTSRNRSGLPWYEVKAEDVTGADVSEPLKLVDHVQRKKCGSGCMSKEERKVKKAQRAHELMIYLGCMDAKTNAWIITDMKRDYNAWREFTAMQICGHCKEFCLTSTFKPYCSGCYMVSKALSLVKKLQEQRQIKPREEDIYVTDAEHESMRKKYFAEKDAERERLMHKESLRKRQQEDYDEEEYFVELNSNYLASQTITTEEAALGNPTEPQTHSHKSKATDANWRAFHILALNQFSTVARH
jgi:hypothetical protein